MLHSGLPWCHTWRRVSVLRPIQYVFNVLSKCCTFRHFSIYVCHVWRSCDLFCPPGFSARWTESKEVFGNCTMLNQCCTLLQSQVPWTSSGWKTSKWGRWLTSFIGKWFWRSATSCYSTFLAPCDLDSSGWFKIVNVPATGKAIVLSQFLANSYQVLWDYC